jgi:hypothetical protein
LLDLIRLIEKRYTSSKTAFRIADLSSIAQYFTLDVLTTIAFGHPFGFIEANDDVYDYIKTVGQFMPVLELQSNLPLVYRILNNRWVRSLLAPTAKDKLGMGRMMEFVLTLLKLAVRIANISQSRTTGRGREVQARQ